MVQFVRVGDCIFPISSIVKIERMDKWNTNPACIEISFCEKCMPANYKIRKAIFEFDTDQDRDEFFDNLANQLDAFWIKKENDND